MGSRNFEVSQITTVKGMCFFVLRWDNVALHLFVLHTVVPRYIAPRYIATLAYRHEIVKNEFPPMLIPPL